ncbi:MAG: hypothetical protein ACOYNN_04080 [Terrimicrobiaceae bacterium]
MNKFELSLPPDVAVFSRGALEFLRPPTQEEWSQIGRYVVASRTCSLRWIADWRRCGRREFGDEVVEQEEKQLEMQFKDMKAAEAIEALEGRGAKAASDEHAFVVSQLCASPEEAEDWLQKSEEHDLSALELQRSIKAGKIILDEDAPPRVNARDKSSGLVTIEGIRSQFDLWLKKVEEDGFPEEWDARRLGMVKNLLNPIRETALKVSVLLMQKGGAE